MYKNTYVTNEKSVQIPKKNMINNVKTTPTNDYSLNKNFFDPAKSSPPNEFMIKLYMMEHLLINMIVKLKRIIMILW